MGLLLRNLSARWIGSPLTLGQKSVVCSDSIHTHIAHTATPTTKDETY